MVSIHPSGPGWKVPITEVLESLSFYKYARAEGMNSLCKLEHTWDFKEIHLKIIRGMYLHGSVIVVWLGLSLFSLWFFPLQPWRFLPFILLFCSLQLLLFFNKYYYPLCNLFSDLVLYLCEGRVTKIKHER